jgi:molybdenum cofactor biosynthesis enzyme MoaA
MLGHRWDGGRAAVRVELVGRTTTNWEGNEASPVEPYVVLERGRQVSERLRVSLTEACNYSCFFCHNEGQAIFSRKRPPLSVADYYKVAAASQEAGISRVKLTGGEPLIYRSNDGNVVDVVSAFRSALPSGDLSITSNGTRLVEFAESLHRAGLDRATVSLITLNSELHRALVSRNGAGPGRTVSGIRAAIAAGLRPVKMNTVLFGEAESLQGNVSEIPRLIDLCRALGVAELRLYPMLRTETNRQFEQRYQYWNRDLIGYVVRAARMSSSAEYDLVAAVLEDVHTGRFEEIARQGRFTVFIPVGELTISLNMMPDDRRLEPCMICGRVDSCQEGIYALRLSATGEIRACLTSDPIASLGPLLADGASVEELATELRRAKSQLSG